MTVLADDLIGNPSLWLRDQMRTEIGDNVKMVKESEGPGRRNRFWELKRAFSLPLRGRGEKEGGKRLLRRERQGRGCPLVQELCEARQSLAEAALVAGEAQADVTEAARAEQIAWRHLHALLFQEPVGEGAAVPV